MARLHNNSSSSRTSTSRSWLRSLVRFRQRFPRLANMSFRRAAATPCQRGKIPSLAGLPDDLRDAPAPSIFHRHQKAQRRNRLREMLEARNAQHQPCALDTTFNSVGYATTDFTASEDTGAAVAYNPTTQDTIVVGTSAGKMAIAAYGPNGSLDATFGSGGLVTLAIGSASHANAVAIDASGNILVAGSLMWRVPMISRWLGSTNTASWTRQAISLESQVT